MNSNQLIQIFQIAFYISIAVMILGFGTAVFLFFRFDIPTVYSLMTGKFQTKTIRKMLQSSENMLGEEDEVLENENYIDMVTDGSKTEKIGDRSDLHGATAQIGFGTGNYETQKTSLLSDTQATAKLETETMKLGADQPTMILNNKPDTTILNSGQYNNTKSSGADYSKSHTEKLSSEPDDKDEAKVNFVNVEHTILVHTDEVIS